MKLSLSWIFDHINGSWQSYDILKLVEQCTLTTAEIADVQHVVCDMQQFTLVRIETIEHERIIGFSVEHGKKYSLPMRTDVRINDICFIKKHEDGYQWAQLIDWFCDKPGLVPVVYCNERELAGDWKNIIESKDYILDIENKSITHRPDLWSHRGFAREFAAMLSMSLVDQDTLLAQLPLHEHAVHAAASLANPFATTLQDPAQCDRFATIYVPHVPFRPSMLSMATRLMRIGARPIDFLVDATNYVMFDLGQPIHAFDADTISRKNIQVCFARSGQTLKLLDNQEITLDQQDLLISDGTNPLALAGIMGGKQTSVTAATQSLLVEAAHFDATTIRLSSVRHKKRTEASTRFEKNIDPIGNTNALRRYVYLLQQVYGASLSVGAITSLGAAPERSMLQVEHAFIQRRIGVQLDSKFVIDTLQMLGFDVQVRMVNDQAVYTILVPSFRQNHIKLSEDIVEEVARFYGFNNIAPHIPYRPMTPRMTDWVAKRMLIKNIVAFSLSSREVNNYPLYDEHLLEQLAYDPSNAVALKNPVSERAYKLVTSLVPHLLHNVVQNKNSADVMRFFEWNRCWQAIAGGVKEEQSLALVWYQKNTPIDFYQCKYALSQLFDALSLQVTWQKAHKPAVWYHPYQTAQLQWQDTTIGYAGRANETFLARVLEGDAFVVELNAYALLNNALPFKQFIASPKFPKATFDISILAPITFTVQQIVEIIQSVDSRIIDVSLIDFFTKDSWHDQRSVTVHCQVQDATKTLDKQTIDQIYQTIIAALTARGCQIR